MPRHLIACVTTILLAMQSAPALAQKVDPAKGKVAKSYVDAGLAAQNAKDYDTAIGLYQKAYDLVPHPVLLFNIGQAHRLAGRMDQAVAFYQRYVTAEPNGAQAKLARDFIAEVAAREAEEHRRHEQVVADENARKGEAARKAQQAEDAKRAVPPPQSPRPTTTTTTVAPVNDIATKNPSSPAVEQSDPVTAGRSLRIAGVATGAAGILVVGLSIYFGLKSKSLSDELSEPGALYSPDRAHDGEVAERNAMIAGAVGGALVVGGVVAYYVGHRRFATAREERVSLLFTPQIVGVSFAAPW